MYDQLLIASLVFLTQIVQGEAKTCWYHTSSGNTQYFYCRSSEYCCGQSCCYSGWTFYRLWYFWLCILFMLMLCSGCGYWYRRRVIYRRSPMVLTGGTTTTTSTTRATTRATTHTSPDQTPLAYGFAYPAQGNYGYNQQFAAGPPSYGQATAPSIDSKPPSYDAVTKTQAPAN